MLALPLRGSTPELYHGKYVAGMFGAGEQGGWYDPSDLSTLFQDAAGTIPVTAVEQPVGRILDKSGRGNHATQTTTASRPVLSARVNLLQKTEQFNDAAWVTSNRATIAANNTLAPDGNLSAERITETTDNGTHRVGQLGIVTNAGSLKFSVSWKKGTRRWVWISINNAVNNCTQFFDLDTITVGSSAINGVGIEKISATITTQNDGWLRCELVVSSIYTSTDVFTGLAPANGTNSYVGTTDYYNWIWGADFRPADQATGLISAYQRVNTETDYDTQGFPLYLRFDGVDDWLVTPSIDFTATDKMTVFCGVRKLSDASIGSIIELSATPTAADTTTRFFVSASPGNVASYGFGMTSNSGASGTHQIRVLTYAAPITNVVAALFDSSFFSGPNRVIPRVNAAAPGSVQVAFEQTGAVAVKFGSFPLFIGRRGGTSLPFNGRLYGLIVRGAQTDDLHLTNAEKFLAYKSGVTL